MTLLPAAPPRSRSPDPLRWDAADLAARLGRALEMASDVVRAFASNGYIDAESPTSSFGPEKVQAETAMLLYAAGRHAHLPEIAERIAAVAALLIPEVRSDRTLLNLALHPSRALSLAVPHVLLTTLGHSDATFDRMLALCLVGQAAGGRERASVEAMEEEWIASLFDGSGGLPRRSAGASIMTRSLDLLGGSREDGYALTHALMYSTDFGLRAEWPMRRRLALLGEARGLLAKCLGAEDYDLAGELLLLWPFTHTPWPAGAIFAWRLLTGVADREGNLPSGMTKPAHLASLEGAARARYLLAMNYHPAYVLGILSAVNMLPGRAPPREILGSPRADAALADRLWEMVSREQRLWQPELEALSPIERRRLAPFLLEVAIAQAWRKQDVDAIRVLLSEALAGGLANSPICAQAAQLMERLGEVGRARDLGQLIPWPLHQGVAIS